MKLTKVIVTFAMLLFGVAVANAQPGGQFGGQFDPEQMAKMRVDRMKESLKLSDEQATQLVALFKKQSEDMMKAMQQNQGGQPDMEAFQKMREQQNAEIKKVLTEEQYKKWEEEQAQMMRGFGGGQGGPQGGPRGGQGGPRGGQGGPRGERPQVGQSW